MRYTVRVDRRPSLARWLDGATPEHPLALQMQEPGFQDLLDRLDELFRQLDVAAPQRLDGKRRDFRALTDQGRWHDLLSELLFARWLIEHRVHFDFGAAGSPQPDLILPTHKLGIEITRRERRPERELRRALYRELKGHPRRPKPVLLLSAHPLSVRQKVLDSIVEEVRRSLARGESHVYAVLRPGRDGHPATTAEIDLYGGWSALPRVVYKDSSARLDVTLLDIEDLILTCLEDKRKSRQGAAMPSVLVVDISDLPQPAWLRPNRIWASRLAALLQREHSYSAVAVMFASVWEPPRFAMGIGRHAQPQTVANLLDWARSMGLQLTT